MFKHLVWISAIAVALMAAVFSVTGIATLFSAKFWAVAAMAGALEVGKLVMASYLYRWWKKTPMILKSYAIAAVVALMIITSIGIYGYLSAAYATVAAVPQNTLNQISFVDTRQESLNGTIERLRFDNANIDSRQAQAQASLDNILAGETELSQRSAFANLRQEIADLDAERVANNARTEVAIAERDSLESVKVGLNAELNTNSDIGPFIYVARTTGMPLDSVVKWFVLMIIVVFDPLAISLILAYNNIVMKEMAARGEEIDHAEVYRKKVKLEPEGVEQVLEMVEDPPEPTPKLKDLMEIKDKSAEIGFDDGWGDVLPGQEIIDEEDLAPPTSLEKAAQATRDFIEQLPTDLVDADLDSDWPEPAEENSADRKVAIVSQPTTPEVVENIEDWPLASDIISPTEEEPEEIGDEIEGEKFPYYMRAGYDWRGREKEWRRDPKAVQYYNEVVVKRPGWSLTILPK
jgi:hypothetical protein